MKKEHKTTKIGLKDLTEKELQDSLKETGEVLKGLNKELSKIDKTFRKCSPQIRLFVADALIGFILQESDLTPFIGISLLEKFKSALLPPMVLINKAKPQDTPYRDYFG